MPASRRVRGHFFRASRFAAAITALAALAIPVTASAEVSPTTPVLRSVQLSIPLATLNAAGDGGGACSANISATFAGFKNTSTGVVYGTWNPWYARTSCTGSLPAIDAQAGLQAPSGFWNYANTASCVLCAPGESVQSNGAPLNCNPCNGEWLEKGTFDYEFPFVPGATLVFGPSCYYNGNMLQVRCVIYGTTVLS
ncbi:MAG: hypothetical protein ACREQ5_07190 [Candidatus Dormibacteria bacterium]